MAAWTASMERVRIVLIALCLRVPAGAVIGWALQSVDWSGGSRRVVAGATSGGRLARLFLPRQKKAFRSVRVRG